MIIMAEQIMLLNEQYCSLLFQQCCSALMKQRQLFMVVEIAFVHVAI